MTRVMLESVMQKGLVKTWDKFAKIYGPNKIGARPIILLNNRLKTTAGRAWIEENKIDLCTRLFVQFPKHFIADTIPHECAHILAYRIYGYDGHHGEPWKRIMRAYGLEPNIYHSMLEWEIMEKDL